MAVLSRFLIDVIACTRIHVHKTIILVCGKEMKVSIQDKQQFSAGMNDNGTHIYTHTHINGDAVDAMDARNTPFWSKQP